MNLDYGLLASLHGTGRFLQIAPQSGLLVATLHTLVGAAIWVGSARL